MAVYFEVKTGTRIFGIINTQVYRPDCGGAAWRTKLNYMVSRSA